jgi:hypothetical protein
VAILNLINMGRRCFTFHFTVLPVLDGQGAEIQILDYYVILPEFRRLISVLSRN